MIKILKQKKGITLIALVVTIIVLLLLAGISISMLAGNNGILNRAGEAKKETEEKSIFENIGLAYDSGKIEKYAGTKTLIEKMEEELVAIYGAENVQVEDYGDDTYTVTVCNEKYNIEDGKIEKDGPIVNPYNPDEWTKAWIYPTEDGTWSEEITEKALLPQNFDIIAKLYEVNESNTKYSLVIEGQGEIKDLIIIEQDSEKIYAWQKGVLSGESIFQNPDNSLEVIICDGITGISGYSFMNCISLKSVKIPHSVINIGLCAFANTNLSIIKIPDSVTSIEDGAFLGCVGLTNVKIPKNVTNIGNYAFQQCINLTNVEIPNGVTSIGEYAFVYTDLTNIKIPDSVTSIGRYAFSECKKLRDIELSRNIESIDLTKWAGGRYLKYGEVTESDSYDIRVKWRDNYYYYAKIDIPSAM